MVNTTSSARKGKRLKPRKKHLVDLVIPKHRNINKVLPDEGEDSNVSSYVEVKATRKKQSRQKKKKLQLQPASCNIDYCRLGCICDCLNAGGSKNFPNVKGMGIEESSEDSEVSEEEKDDEKRDPTWTP